MEKTNKNYESIYMFCTTILIYCSITLTLFFTGTILQYVSAGILEIFYEIFCYVFGFFFFAGGLLSLIWLVILIVWCNVIRKKERSNQIFRKPLITISFLGAIIYFISVVVTILNGF
jgi:hypothetical protein